jgi:hypothetical protein
VLHKNRVPLALAWYGGPEAMRLGSAVQTEGLGFAVVFAEVPVDRGLEVEQRLEDAELQFGSRGTESLQTRRWREMDSNPRSPERRALPVDEPYTVQRQARSGTPTVYGHAKRSSLDVAETQQDAPTPGDARDRSKTSSLPGR